MARKHSFAVHWRAFLMWQHLGFMPWKKPRETAVTTGDFYKGAFDASIPFLNADAKRTFQHLMLRPGHMIRDYIRGEHGKYLAPLTALIVFYAFFALVSSLLQPVQSQKKNPLDNVFDSLSVESELDSIGAMRMSQNVVQIVRKGYLYLHLDQFPEAVHTQREAALAALEGTLRNQGIPLFIYEFFFLWLAMSMALPLRRYQLNMSACAAASAYILCQFSFFMLFAVLLTWGRSASISVLLMMFLLVVDYRQWLGLSWRKSLRMTIRTGLFYGVVYCSILLLVSALVLILAYFKS